MPVGSRRDSGLVQAHGDLLASPRILGLQPSGGPSGRLPGTAAQSCTTSPDTYLAVALTPTLHPGPPPPAGSTARWETLGRDGRGGASNAQRRPARTHRIARPGGGMG